MIPESVPMTLDSILEGILDEEVSSGPTDPSSPVGDNSSSSQRSAASSVTSSPSRMLVTSSGTVLDLPCLAIKAEMPDSCSMEVMVGEKNMFGHVIRVHLWPIKSVSFKSRDTHMKDMILKIKSQKKTW